MQDFTLAPFSYPISPSTRYHKITNTLRNYRSLQNREFNVSPRRWSYDIRGVDGQSKEVLEDLIGKVAFVSEVYIYVKNDATLYDGYIILPRCPGCHSSYRIRTS